MMMNRAWLPLLMVALSTTALAQEEDDDLAPLAPLKGDAKPKPKPKAKPKPKPAATTQSDDLDLAPIAPIAAKGDLVIKLATNVAGAVLSIDGKDVGALPLGTQSVPAGEHTVSVRRPGYAAFVKKVQVPGGKTVDVEAKLVAVAAVLSVTSDVPGATVLLNGRPIGTAPMTDVEVPAGPAEVTVLKDGFSEQSQKVSFVAGRDYPLTVKLSAGAPRTLTASDRPVNATLTPSAGDANAVALSQPGPSQPITSKWYFWVGIAAGAAAIAATSAAIAVGSAPRPLTEQDLCGAEGCDACIGLSCFAAPGGRGSLPLGSF